MREIITVFYETDKAWTVWHSDTMWRFKSRSTLVQVMACELMAPSHYLNQWLFIIGKVQWHSCEGNFGRITSATNHKIRWTITYLNFHSSLPVTNDLTHLPWCRIYASVNWVIINSGNGLSPVRRQATTWTNAPSLSIGLMRTNFNGIWIRILSFSFKKINLNMSSAKMAAILSSGGWVNVRCSDITETARYNILLILSIVGICVISLVTIRHYT